MRFINSTVCLFSLGLLSTVVHATPVNGSIDLSSTGTLHKRNNGWGVLIINDPSDSVKKEKPSQSDIGPRQMIEEFFKRPSVRKDIGLPPGMELPVDSDRTINEDSFVYRKGEPSKAYYELQIQLIGPQKCVPHCEGTVRRNKQTKKWSASIESVGGDKSMIHYE
ncbi:hypothetical protein GYMLUDRAFT_245247 [Collybiopsis luxurians FD-317 M1]|uniref:Uncharacterized protein n=1 Tax=Collybiopsis luxurians FD-317 M1 TaxID=944289 RepID=A0A0D0CUR1_9AGAR|nr:hypothetical protein GYMLUDRAFT_245247 [Collybiopsis luxurians FD-317 M1]